MTRSQLLAALITISFSTGLIAAPAATPVKKQEVKKVEKKKEVKPAPKKDDGKIKPLAPNRKVPTLKKKYRKED